MTANPRGTPRRSGGKAAARRVMVRGGVVATSLLVLAASWFGVSQTTVGRTVRAAAAAQAYAQPAAVTGDGGGFALGTSATTSGFIAAPAAGSTHGFVTRSRAS